MTKSVSLALRAVLLAFLLFLFFAFAAFVSGVADPSPPPGADPVGVGVPASGQGAPSGAGALFLFCALVSAAFTWAIARSSNHGWPLVAAVFLAYFGLGTLLPQMESALFLESRLPPGFVWRLIVMGAIVAALFAPVAARVLGRWPSSRALLPPPPAPSRWSLLDWTWRLALLAVVYVAVYLLAGYFIAYRNPELVAFYHDTDPGSFLAQIKKIGTSAPWLLALQALRGVLWVAFVIPLVLWFTGGRQELGFLIASLYAVWSAMLLAPNPYMPESVRLSHLVETVCSNFGFGWLVGALMHRGAR